MSEKTKGVRALFDADEVREVLEETFYKREPAKAPPARKRKRAPKKAEVPTR